MVVIMWKLRKEIGKGGQRPTREGIGLGWKEMHQIPAAETRKTRILLALHRHGCFPELSHVGPLGGEPVGLARSRTESQSHAAPPIIGLAVLLEGMVLQAAKNKSPDSVQYRSLTQEK